MNKIITAYPLCWPEGRPRTPETSRKKARYDVSFHKALHDLRESLRLMKAYGIVVSTDVSLRRDGWPHSDGDPNDPGVVVYFTRKDEEHIIAIDCWRTVRDNTRAVGLAIDGFRAVARSGAEDVIDRTFSGFRALPAVAGPSKVERPWREVLELVGVAGPPHAVRVMVDFAYRELVKKLHPDNRDTGDVELFHELQFAYERAGEELTGG